MNIEELLSEKEAARLLGLTPFALRKWRNQRRGPEFIRLSLRCVRYKLADIKAFIDERSVDPAADHWRRGTR